MMKHYMVFSTFPDIQAAETAVHSLLEKRLIACASIIDSVRSLYRWQGTIEESTEVLLKIKTSGTVLSEAIAILERLHPYEVPEIVAVKIEQGNVPYLKWIEECTC